MNSITRRALVRTAMALPAAAWIRAVPAQTGGTTGRLLVGYPAGGTLDTTARQLAEAWRKTGWNYIVDNRAGAAGRIANSQLKREPPDASVLLCTHSAALTIYPHVYSRLMYNTATDFVPVSPLVVNTCAFAVSTTVPPSVKSIADYIEWVRNTPSGANYASPAAGTVAHFLGFILSEAAGLKLQHIAYKGSAPAMQDLLGGQIPAYFGFVGDFLPYMHQGRIRILGVAAEKRSPFLPSVPTFVEQGHARIRGGETLGVFAPPRTPDVTVRSLYEAIVTASKDPGLRAAFEKVGLEVYTQAPQEYANAIQRERDAWGPVVRASGFRLDD